MGSPSSRSYRFRLATSLFTNQPDRIAALTHRLTEPLLVSGPRCSRIRSTLHCPSISETAWTTLRTPSDAPVTEPEYISPTRSRTTEGVRKVVQAVSEMREIGSAHVRTTV